MHEVKCIAREVSMVHQKPRDLVKHGNKFRDYLNNWPF